MSTLQAAVLLAAVLAVIVGLAVAVRGALRRSRPAGALVALAAERGLAFAERDDAEVREVGYPFGLGQDQRAENVLRGRVDDRQVTAFDYSYRVPGPAGTWITRRFGVVVVGLPAALPEMELVELDQKEKPTTFLGLDLVVTRDPDFNARFRVRAADTDLAAQVLERWTQEALLGCPPLRLRIMGAEARSWKRGRLAAHDLDRHLSCLAALVDGIPPTVWIEHRRSA